MPESVCKKNNHSKNGARVEAKKMDKKNMDFGGEFW